MAATSTNTGFRFLDLPLELRLEVYGHYFKLPFPMQAFKFYHLDLRPPLLATVYRQVHDELREHIRDLYGRENVFAVDNMYQGLTYFTDCLGEVMRRTIRHIRVINFDFLCAVDITGKFIKPGTPDYLKAWAEGRHTAFNHSLQKYSRSRYFENLPTTADLIRISRQYLPNLTSLTLDIGRIDHLTGELPNSWLREPQHTRNQRYRLVVQKTEECLPSNFPNGLSVIIHARMDPIQFVDDIGAHIAAQRPILHVTLTFEPRESSEVHIVESLPKWQTVQDGRYDEIEWMAFPEMSVTRTMLRVEDPSSPQDVGILFDQGFKPIQGFHI